MASRPRQHMIIQMLIERSIFRLSLYVSFYFLDDFRHPINSTYILKGLFSDLRKRLQVINDIWHDENKFKIRVQKKNWKACTAQQNKILALQAQVKKLENKKATRKADIASGSPAGAVVTQCAFLFCLPATAYGDLRRVTTSGECSTTDSFSPPPQALLSLLYRYCFNSFLTRFFFQ